MLTEILEQIARPLLAIARFLFWLAWEWFFHTISWSVGWPICKLLSFGRFPEAGFRDIDEASDWAAFVVCFLGLVTLAGIICFLKCFIAQS
jgi:hypothetical protein